MSDRLKDFGKSVDIELPEDLDGVIYRAIERGRLDMRRKKSRVRAFKGAMCAVFLLAAVFAAGVNTVPAFAEAMEGIQGLAGIVRVLQFDRDRAAGGELTDGQDIGAVDWEKGGEEESILVSLLAEGSPAGLPGSFEVLKEQYPGRLVLKLHGVRGISADITAPENSEYVEDIYRLVTLDDSSQRLVVSFKKAVDYQVAEVEDPAGILLTIKPAAAESLPELFSLRTPSLEFGEQVGVWEEVLTWEYGGKDVRQLKDSQGTFFVEEGLYESEGEALDRLGELQEMGLDFPLMVEKVDGLYSREYMGQ